MTAPHGEGSSDNSISRRDFMHLAAKFGAGLAAAGGLASLLQACGGAAAVTTTTTRSQPSTTRAAASTATSLTPPTTVGLLTTTTLAPATTTLAANSWVDLKPPHPVPYASTYTQMVYDPVGNTVILFGGSGGVNEGNGWGTPQQNTWAYDPAGNTWLDVGNPPSTPPARMLHSMVYASSMKKVILFGGMGTPDPIKGFPYLRDTWSYDPATNTWTELKPGGVAPSVSFGASMAYDPTTDRVVLFGGAATLDARMGLRQTWAYDVQANAWSNLKPKGPVPPGGSPITYDPNTGLIVLFGGFDQKGHPLGGVWVYDPGSNTWTKRSPKGSAPPSRYNPSVVYDEAGHRVILLGGFTTHGTTITTVQDIWAYDPRANVWTRSQPTGVKPPARLGQTVTYDSALRVVILYGGLGGKDWVENLDDTWAFYPG